MFLHVFGLRAYIQRKYLEVRNNVIASQYEELNESYKKYRCLIHDERHMMDYIEECIGTGNFSEAQKNHKKKSRNKIQWEVLLDGHNSIG